MIHVHVEVGRNTKNVVGSKSPIIGHLFQREQLLADIENDNVAHAYLFEGQKNLGKRAVAKWFASELLLSGISDEKKENAKSEIERLIYPDLLVLDRLWIEGVHDDWDHLAKYSNVPQAHRAKKPAAKTDTISIDDIRALQERLYETPVGTWRCCIIRSIGRMQDPAANAFLKILEEPPKGLVFILTTSALSSLLPTVVSRTRVIPFLPLSHEELLPLFTELSEEDTRFILHIVQGAPGLAVKLRDDPDALREERLMHSQAKSFWESKSVREKLSLLKPLAERGNEANRFLLHLSLTLREMRENMPSVYVHALTDLASGLETNAHRQLLCQKFALSIA